MFNRMKVVIVVGVAAGPEVAARIVRLMADAEVTIIEKGEFLSYAGCGLPYYVSGVVKEQAELMPTPVGVVRDPVFFQKVKNLRVMSQTEAMKIDRAGKRVQVRNGDNETESWLAYDKLILATGGVPVVPPLPNVKLDNIFTLHGVYDAEGIKAAGFPKVRVMDGGIAMWPFEKLSGSQKPPNDLGNPTASAAKARA